MLITDRVAEVPVTMETSQGWHVGNPTRENTKIRKAETIASWPGYRPHADNGGDNGDEDGDEPLLGPEK